MIRSLVVMIAAATALAAADEGVEKAWTVIEGGVSESNPLKRRDAVAALEAAERDPKTIALLEAALKDKDIDVRQTAVSVLGAVHSTRSIPHLRASLEDPAPQVSFTAAKTLWDLGDHSGRDILIAVIEAERSNSSGIIKESMREAMKKLHNPNALAMIGIKEGAGAFLGPFGFGITVIEELRKDASATARTIAAAALATDKDPATLVNLTDALSDKNWVVRAAAAKALSTRGNRAAIEKLEPLLDDKQEGVRCVAAASILRLSSLPKRRRLLR